jgi:hypothetical protein
MVMVLMILGLFTMKTTQEQPLESLTDGVKKFILK